MRSFFRDVLEMQLAPRTWEDRLAQAGYALVGDRAVQVRQPSSSRVLRDCPTEDAEQMALIKWRDESALLQEPRLALLYHIPNGKRRSKAAAGQLKAMGVKRGIPDLFLPVGRHGFHGLYVEVKALDGTVSAEQKTLHAQLRAQGYAVEVAYGWVMAAQQLCRYLSRPDLAQQLGETA